MQEKKVHDLIAENETHHWSSCGMMRPKNAVAMTYEQDQVTCSSCKRHLPHADPRLTKISTQYTKENNNGYAE